MTVKELIRKHGGIAAVRKASGIPAQTIWNWMDRKTIPVRHWPKLIEIGMSQNDILAAHIKDSQEVA